MTILHTAVRPMANGPSVPSIEVMAKNVELLGYSHNLDTSKFSPVADHFEKVGIAAGFWSINMQNMMSCQYDIKFGVWWEL